MAEYTILDVKSFPTMDKTRLGAMDGLVIFREAGKPNSTDSILLAGKPRPTEAEIREAIKTHTAARSAVVGRNVTV